ncbi:MAG: 50S ribosomal protein L29 [Rickettsiales bacterium]|jgi:ribosomal protein L29|nr:50S ribosomal protein L29 [Rickettsiales bacterium]
MKKNNDIVKMKTASADEVNSKIIIMKRDIMKHRFELISGQLKNTSVIGKIRKDVARLKTYLQINSKTKDAKKTSK